jgi:hypothetical protein
MIMEDFQAFLCSSKFPREPEKSLRNIQTIWVRTPKMLACLAPSHILTSLKLFAKNYLYTLPRMA